MIVLRLEEHPRLMVGPDGAWFQLPGAPRVQIDRRKHLRRLIVALANQRQRAAGAVLSVEEMFEAGWPGDRAIPKAAATRVYTAIHSLRTMGIGDLIVRRNGGYSLHALVEWTRDSAIVPALGAEASVSDLAIADVS